MNTPLKGTKWEERPLEQKTKILWIKVQITHGYTWTRGKVTIMSTPCSYRSMPKHFRCRWLTWTWIWRFLGCCVSRVTDVNFLDKPLQRIGFDHRRGGSRLNGRKTVDPRTETVARIGPNSTRIFAVDDSWTSGKSWLTSPNFVPFFWNFFLMNFSSKLQCAWENSTTFLSWFSLKW